MLTYTGIRNQTADLKDIFIPVQLKLNPLWRTIAQTGQTRHHNQSLHAHARDQQLLQG